jgi:hypothetical protein
MKVSCFGVTQHFVDEINWILDLTVSVRLPSFNDDRRTNHVTCS